MRKLCCLLVSLAACSAWAQPQYEVVDLTKMFGDELTAVDINNSGVVVGHMRLNPSQDQACVIQNGKLTMLPMYLGVHPWYALAISDNGDVLGSGRFGSGESRTVLYRNGKVIDLGLPGTVEFPAGRAMNNNGLVVGAIDPVGPPYAFVWENGVTTTLPGLSTGSSGAADINDAGAITGTSQVDGGGSPFHAVRWDGGKIEDLHPTWAGTSTGVAINSLGDNSRLGVRAIRWTAWRTLERGPDDPTRQLRRRTEQGVRRERFVAGRRMGDRPSWHYAGLLVGKRHDA